MEEIFTINILISVIIFILIATITPGPNNILLLSSGLNFGYKKTLPLLVGIIVGVNFMMIALGFGFDIIFKKYPFFTSILKIFGSFYILYLAYKIANDSSSYKLKNLNQKPINFIQAILLQLINPKIWISIITTISLYANNQKQLFVIEMIFFIFSTISGIIWVLGGIFLKQILKNQKQLQILNYILAFCLILCILPNFIEF